MSATSVVVVGGGVSGLATAYLIKRKRPELNVAVLEEAPEPGGKTRSGKVDGYTVDWGPNGFLTNVPETLELATSLGLKSILQRAADSAKQRFLYKDGGLRALPASPLTLLKSELLSPLAKLRAAAEVFVKPGGEEETVFDFVARRFGVAFADAFAGPMVLGITSGDAREVSLDALFARVRQMEAQHGSLIRALIHAQREAKAQGKRGDGRLTSFATGGVQRLVDALSDSLGTALKTGVSVNSLTRQAGGGYRLTLESAGAAAGELAAGAVVLATPAFVSAALLEPFVPEASAELKAIAYADVQVYGLGYDRTDVPRALDGFGFLVPRGQGLRSLGVLYSSSIFPDQAPPGKVLLRVIAGGSVDPAFIDLSCQEALAAVQRDLHISMGISAAPEMVKHIPWPKGIPQYSLGHGARVARIMDATGKQPGLYLTGNAYYGVGLNDCVRDAHRVAHALLAAR